MVPYRALSESLISAVFAASAVLFAFALAILASIVLLRLRRALRERRERPIIESWRMLFAQCALGVPDKLPHMDRRCTYEILKLWNYHHEVLRGTATSNLNIVACTAGFDVTCRLLLHDRNVRNQLIAVVTLGHLRDQQSWGDLVSLLQDRSSIVSLAAARATLHLRPAEAAYAVLDMVARREDWPITKVAPMLKEVGPDILTPALVHALTRAAHGSLPRAHITDLVRLLVLAHSHEAASIVRELLATHHEKPDVVTACLRALVDPHDMRLVRDYADDPNWNVRVAVAKAIARLGTASDVPVLERMLDDAHWWVRNNAAHALLTLWPAATDRNVLTDALNAGARRALDHAIAEKQLT